MEGFLFLPSLFLLPSIVSQNNRSGDECFNQSLNQDTYLKMSTKQSQVRFFLNSTSAFIILADTKT